VAGIFQKSPQTFTRARQIGQYFKYYNGPQIHERYTIVSKYYSETEYRYTYSEYFDDGFVGGYYYPVRPCDNVTDYFDYPEVQWFYVDTAEPDYYQGYYGPDDYQQYPVQPFEFARVYFPTETLRDLAVEVSGLDAGTQAVFRDAITRITENLQQSLTDNLADPFEFVDNDIVVTHYTNLQNQAYVLEGFVDRENLLDLHVAFKALLDLTDASQSIVFAPVGPEPLPEELDLLAAINDRIVALGGDPITAVDEPTPEAGELASTALR
jgi:hypothetical protein